MRVWTGDGYVAGAGACSRISPRRRSPSVLIVIGLLLLTGVLLAAAPAAQAKPAGGTWTGLGDSGYWSDNLNWNGNTLPANGVSLTFPAAASTGNDAMTSTVLTQVGTISFQRSGYKLYYSSTSPQLSLASGAIISGNFTTGTVTWGPRLTLAANASFGAAAGGTLAFGGAAVNGGGDVVLGTYRLSILGYGTVALNGVLSGRGQALPGMALYVGRSNGTTVLLNGQSTYSGKTVISLGTAKLGIADAIKRCSGVVDDPDGASYLELEGATLDLNGFALAVNELESTYTAAAIANTSATAATLTVGSDDLVNHAACSYAGILSGGGVVNITKDKANSLTFTGNASAGTGGHLEVSGGSVAVGSGTALAFTDGATVSSGGSLIVDGTLSSTATVAGTLGGGGTLDKWIVLSPGGTLCPSSPGFTPTTLYAGTGASGGQCDAGSTLRFAVGDATGAAGAGYDQWAPSGVSLMGSTATPVKVELASVHGGAAGPCDNWDKTISHRWHVVSTSGTISGFATDKVSLDTTAFETQNDVGGGTFAVEQKANGSNVIDVVFTPAASAAFSAAPTVGAGGTSFTIGTTQMIAWGMTAPVSGGHFNVVANDAEHQVSYLVESLAADGAADYSWQWPTFLAAGTGWHVTIEYDDAGGSTVTSSDSTTFALQRPVASISSPNRGSFTRGDTETVSWSMTPAVDGGSFRVWLKDTASGAWVRVTPSAGPIAAEAGKTAYSVPWSVTQPLGTYRLWVYYYGPDGTTVVTTATSSGTLTIAAKPLPSITSPNSGSFSSGSSTTVEWSINTAVSTGSFRVWLKNTVTNAWVRITPSASPVPAVPGETAYSVPWTVAQPVGAYRLWVYYYATDGTTVLSSAVSSGTLTIGPKPVPTVVSPNSGSFTRGSGTTVEWSMNTAVSTGSFRVWLKNTVTNAWVRVTPTASPIMAEAGKTAYRVTWFVTQPAGIYRLWVYYYAADGTTVASTAVSIGTVTITAP